MAERLSVGISSKSVAYSQEEVLIKPNIPGQPQGNNLPLLSLNNRLSRRQFTRLFASAAVNLATSQMQSEGAAASSNETSRATSADEENNEQKPTLLDTAQESSVLGASLLVGADILNSLGIPIGNASLKGYEEARGKKSVETNLTPTPVGTAYGCVGIAIPILEEAVFRLVPSALLSATGAKGIHWEVGIPATAVFALSHSISAKDAKNGVFKFYKTPVPVPQAILGLYAWKLMRERGFAHAALAHILWNLEGVTYSLAKLKFKQFLRDNKKNRPNSINQ